MKANETLNWENIHFLALGVRKEMLWCHSNKIPLISYVFTPTLFQSTNGKAVEKSLIIYLLQSFEFQIKWIIKLMPQNCTIGQNLLNFSLLNWCVGLFGNWLTCEHPIRNSERIYFNLIRQLYHKH
jgi:hypothetical protein